MNPSAEHPSLKAILHAGGRRACPGLELDGLDKSALLEAVLARRGASAVVELGRELRSLSDTPVMRTLVASPGVVPVVQRWQRLERFGHARHRTMLIGAEVDGPHARLRLQHVALGGGPVPTGNDLFVWGLLIGLLEMAGAEGIEARWPQGARLWPLEAAPGLGLPEDTATLGLEAVRRVEPSPLPPLDDGRPDGLGRRLAACIAHDPSRAWDVRVAAVALQTSSRSLQRALRGEGTSFSEVLARTRVGLAHELLHSSALSLTEIGFCVGFADQAHFSRTYRKFNEVPPSAVRGLRERSAQTSSMKVRPPEKSTTPPEPSLKKTRVGS